jgi:hypothetical protein
MYGTARFRKRRWTRRLSSRSSTVSRIAELRRRADFCRQAAQVPTEGGRHADRILLVIADGLEREAAALEARTGIMGIVTIRAGDPRGMVTIP